MTDPNPATAPPDAAAAAAAADEPAGGVAAPSGPVASSPPEPATATPLKKRLVEFFAALDKAIRADRMYRGQGNIVERLNAELLRRAQAICEGDVVIARVASVGIVYDGEPVTSPDERTDYLFRLYCDGVRELTFLPGIEAAEVAALVSVFKTDIRDSDDDLVTLLWRQNLEHVRYYAVDSFTGAGADDSELARRSANAKLDRDGAGDVEIALSSSDLRVLRTDDLLDWVREAAAPKRPDAESAPLAEKVLGAWDNAATPGRFLAVALRSVAHAGDGGPRADGMVLGVYDAMLRGGDAAGVAACLDAVSPARGPLSPAVVALRSRMVDDERVPRLAALLDHAPEALMGSLMALQPAVPGALVGVLTAIPSGETEERLQAALGAAGVDLTPYYARRLQSDDTEEVLRAIAALGRIGSAVAMDALGQSLSSTLTAVRRAALEAMQGHYDPARRVQLSRCLKDPDHDNRVLALKIIAQSGDARMGWALLSLAEDASFVRMNPEEQRGIFRALGQFKDDRMLSHFRKLLSERNLTRSKQLVARQEMVVEALQLMGTDGAHALAKEFSGKWHLPRSVSDALSRALATWGAAP